MPKATDTAITTTILTLSKSTKGTHVYSNKDDDAPIPSLYIKRSAAGGDSPWQEIEITIKGK